MIGSWSDADLAAQVHLASIQARSIEAKVHHAISETIDCHGRGSIFSLAIDQISTYCLAVKHAVYC